MPSENKKLNDVIDCFKEYQLSKHITYEFLPVITFESSAKCYVNNKILEKLLTSGKKYPHFIDLLIDEYEAWSDWNFRLMIKDDKIAKWIINESREIVKKYKSKIGDFLNSDFSKLDNKEMVNILNEIDVISTETYHAYIFFIDECFDIKNKDIIDVLPKVRIELSDFVSDIYTCCDKIIKSLSERFNDINRKIFCRATFSELIELLNDSDYISDFKQIDNRPIGFVANNNRLTTLFGQDVKRIKTYLEHQEKDKEGKETVLKGMIVYPGITKGEAVVLPKSSDYRKVKEIIGNRDKYILIAPMTRPELAPFIKKSIGIVTNEGGITCHAAIISRELKIPCIVGTSNATKLIKTGDTIELDSNKGIVKIIKD